MKKLITGITLLTSVAFFGQTNKLDSTGNVGVGITSPISKLHVYNDDSNITEASGLTIEQKGTGNSQLQYLLTGVQRWVTGIDNSDGDKFILGRGLNWANGKDLTITNTGSIGIGTNSPVSKLHVYSNDSNITDATGLTIEQKGTGDSQLQYLLTGVQRWVTGIDNSDGDKFVIGRGVNWATGKDLVITKTGNVAIGSVKSSEDSKLAVEGKIHCEEVQVDLDVAPDYVFEKYYTGVSDLKEEYTMPTLEEVEAYTKENHHLPSIPSAKTIKEEGLHLKEMTNLLLQKIEELTLYTIEQNKELKTLKEKVTLLENK